MKTPRLQNPLFLQSGKKGFTLVITLTLMILLTVIAVGLLTLSSVSLRAASQGESMALARANARLALMLAIGELQATTGSDRSITAPASLQSDDSPYGLTGAWEAWDANQEDFSEAPTRSKFRRWLVSCPNDSQVTDPSKPYYAGADDAGAALLLGNGSLGKRRDRMSDDQRIALQPVRMTSPSQSGAFAWAVIDESVKSRVDLYDYFKEKKDWTNVARAGAPAVFGVSALDGWDRFSVGKADQSKLTSLGSLPLTDLVDQNNTLVYDPDVTVYPNTLMTDPVNGGLKKDLSMMSSRNLSSLENATRLYQSSSVISDAVPSDPYVSLLTEYHNLYQYLGERFGRANPNLMEVAPLLPRRYTPYAIDGRTNGFKVNRAALKETVLAPSVLRVDMIFSMIVRNTHGGWKNLFGSDRYLLHMQYLPVVTLHNPYNVPMVFEGMKVSFKNLPVGFNFTVDGQDLSTSLVPLNQMYVWYAGSDSNSKDFGVTLKPGVGSSGAGTMILEPGQTKIFGTPKVPPTWTWFNENPGVGADGTHLFDWRSNMTSEFDMSPKLMTTSTASSAGFDIDWINPQVLQTDAGRVASKGGGNGMVGLLGSERLGVKFGPYAPSSGKGAFSVAIDLIVNGRESPAGIFNVKYGVGNPAADQKRLNELFAEGTSVRYPKQRSFPATYPRAGVDPPITAGQIFEDGGTPLRDYVKAKPFMIFSLAAKTTQESFLPCKTLLTGNSSSQTIDIDLRTGKDPQGGVPLEMVMMPISPGTPAIEELRNKEEGFFFGGNGSLRGTPRATFYELPLIPLQSLAQFRHANLTNSGYMPFTTYTVGESFAHPQIGTNVTRENWTDNSVMLDHAYLSNKALWDQYFLSTVTNYDGPLFSKNTRPVKKVLEDFFEGGEDAPKLINPRFVPYGNEGLVPEVLNDAASGSPAFKYIAGYLMLEGGFNVNSTSVDAWKTLLSAMDKAEIDTVFGTEIAGTGEFPVPRVRRPSDKAIDGQALVTREARWQGYRRLSTEQIDTLAKEIVKEVKTRGPFLSLADFVNRQVGEGDSELTTKGAIQAAIDRTSINNRTKVDGVEVDATMVAKYDYKSVAAGIGNSATLAPGMLSQGDVMTVIGARVAVRGDTFRIRSYGDARSRDGTKVLASAWCEAVVQRVPAYVDGTDKQTVAYTDLSPVNRRFGRRYVIVSFRWLSPKEV